MNSPQRLMPVSIRKRKGLYFKAEGLHWKAADRCPKVIVKTGAPKKKQNFSSFLFHPGCKGIGWHHWPPALVFLLQ